ncbi:MAG: FAD-dependent oxidoreductase [Clostridia bacterium]|nr:FAD-dependent oxidoreductase [Clostridia bacterium]
MNVKKLSLDLAVIGGGVAGMAAAISASHKGIKDIGIFEINDRLGGVLGQCIHAGFGLHTFNEELTGPEYSARFEEMTARQGIKVFLRSPVTELRPDRTMTVVSRDEGILEVSAKAIVIAQGCRERPAGAIGLDGTRPAGVMTAGTAQKYVNMDGYMVGRRVVILGSGDIGLIMARRMTLEGAKVLCVCELMPYSNGLNRNIVQCLQDYDIPLRLSCTVVGLEGKGRLTGVRVAPVDPDTLKPDLSKTELIPCDTLLLSVGLIPETGLAADAGADISSNRGLAVSSDRSTSLPGVFACGNVVHVHDLVDYVAEEGKLAGESAADFVLSNENKSEEFALTLPQNGISYVVPQKISLPADSAELSFRVKKVFNKAKLVCRCNGEVICEKRRSVMLPGEMEKLTIPAAKLTANAVVSVEVEEN